MSRLIARFDVAFPEFHLQAEIDLPCAGANVIFGASGSGKSTLLRCLAGLERSPSGFLQVGEEVWQDEAKGIFLPTHKRAVGVVFQEPRLFPHMSVLSNLRYGFERIPPPDRAISPEQVIAVLGIGHLLDRRPHRLSGGEKQRVAIGRALLASPRLMLMDEPLASLDANRKREILPFILRLKGEFGIPIIYVSHDIDEVLQLVDRIVILEAGRVAAVGPVAEVFSRLDLRGHIEPSLLGAALDTRVAGHEPEFSLTRVEFMGRQMYIPHQNAEVGQPVRLHVLARDVSLTLDPPGCRASALNILPGIITEVGLVDIGGYSVDVKLDVGCPLLATVTRKSFANLGLRPGLQVYALIKAVQMAHESGDI